MTCLTLGRCYVIIWFIINVTKETTNFTIIPATQSNNVVISAEVWQDRETDAAVKGNRITGSDNSKSVWTVR